MDAREGTRTATALRYCLKPTRIKNEDILFCIDVDVESTVEMKATGTNGRSCTRLECMKQAILLFINAKLAINPDHRFAFASLAKSATWLKKEFSSDVDSASAVLRGLQATSSCPQADLTYLFRLAAHEAKKSRAQNRILRVILLYSRSSVQPQHHFTVTQKLFTLDVMYLHEKPNPGNCPQDVFDGLVEILENVSEYEGYIHESGQGLARSIYRCMSVLLSHPQQRCSQDGLDIPKSLTRKVLPAEPTASS